MDPQECLRKAYVKLRYIPPTYMPPRQPEQPVDCKFVKVSQGPDIRTLTGQISVLEGRPRDEIIGIDLHCSVIATSGDGGIILLLQVSSYIEWEVEFSSTKGNWVSEWHRVFVSLPMMHKIEGPRVAINLISGKHLWKTKLVGYAAQIAAAFRKLEEMEKVMAPILKLKKGFCPDDIKAMESALKKYETELNHLLQRAARDPRSDDGIARRMHHDSYGTGRFAGNRVA